MTRKEELLKAPKLLGTNLRKLREERGLSLASLATKLQFSVLEIVAIEDGNWHAFHGSRERYIQLIEAYANEIGVDPLEFDCSITKNSALTAKEWGLPSVYTPGKHG